MECDCCITKSVAVRAGAVEVIRCVGIILCLYTFSMIGGCASSMKGKDSGQEVDRRMAAHTDSVAQDISDSSKQSGYKAGDEKDSLGQPGLTNASQLMIKACDNYLAVNHDNQKIPEVLGLKASVLYNNKLFSESRKYYKELLDKYPESHEVVNAVRMIAQAYYEEKQFDKAQVWYRKLKDIAGEGGDKEEAVARIAESIFRMAESYEKQQNYKKAAEQYERVAMEYPDSKIADIALFNAGLSYEKETEWSHAALMYQRLSQKYGSSRLLPKAKFRSAKCYEKLMQWENAGEMYLRVVAGHPTSEMAPAALYNAGFSFENANKLPEAAATFEKMAQLFPKSEDAADVLFRAGEIYGKLKDWESVTRVNQEFSKRFGNDVDRIVQAQCMVGVALYMQEKEREAVEQLKKAVTTFDRLRNPSTVNKYYAAKAQFTLAEIYHENMKKVALSFPESLYRKQIRSKSRFLDEAITGYSKTIQYKIFEWTTRSIFQIGQVYEDFAIGVMKQKRPENMSMDERFALELGIARAIDENFVENALHYHEENVKLGVKEKNEDKYILASRKKLTFLPLSAGKNYLHLTEILGKIEKSQNLTGFALIARKLETLQKIAPFQERAIDLFLKSLEMGSKYHEADKFYHEAATLITKVAYTVGETYAEVTKIAREAPVPQSFDAYEKFVYKTKLLKQIESYEDQALNNFLKVLKIADAYELEDNYIKKSREDIARVIFTRGRCYDLLFLQSFNNPPYPADADEVEKEEYKVQFEEVGLRFQEQALEIYKTVLDYAEKNFASGKYVVDAYVRLYQNYPEDYGVKREKVATKHITSGPQWKCLVDSIEGWRLLDTKDNDWLKVQKTSLPDSIVVSGFPADVPPPMWIGKGDPDERGTYKPASQLYLRRKFYVREPVHEATLYAAGIGPFDIYFNENKLPVDSSQTVSFEKARKYTVTGMVREGKNVFAVHAEKQSNTMYGFIPYLEVNVTDHEYIPLPPGTNEPLDPEKIKESVYIFDFIENFSPEKEKDSTDQ
ncbi:MAG: tetratricopeptide repeat protein [Chitinivibrionales bacterium]|nr:tetratricopeptide repeat protein [Chitinivibrionales bacterium]